jgi:hypothetical protein
MTKDPIVAEVRKAGMKLQRRAGGDLKAFFALLRQAESCEHREGKRKRFQGLTVDALAPAGTPTVKEAQAQYRCQGKKSRR